jgi:hypothetical protein
MSQVPFNRDSLDFTARRSVDGIEVKAEFQAPRLSNPDAGLRYYSVTLIIDPDTRGVSGRDWCMSRDDRSEPVPYEGGKDRLRLLEKQIRDEVIKRFEAWPVLLRREADPNYVVDQHGDEVPREPPVGRRPR